MQESKEEEVPPLEPPLSFDEMKIEPALAPLSDLKAAGNEAKDENIEDTLKSVMQYASEQDPPSKIHRGEESVDVHSDTMSMASSSAAEAIRVEIAAAEAMRAGIQEESLLARIAALTKERDALRDALAEAPLLPPSAAPSLPPPEPQELSEIPNTPEIVSEKMKEEVAETAPVQSMEPVLEEEIAIGLVSDGSIMPVFAGTVNSATESIPDDVSIYSAPEGVTHGANFTAWDVLQVGDQSNPDDSINIKTIPDAEQRKMAISFIFCFRRICRFVIR